MRTAKVSSDYKATSKRRKMKREDAIADAKMARMRAKLRSATRNNNSPPSSSSSSSSITTPPPPIVAEQQQQQPADDNNNNNNNNNKIVIDLTESSEAEEEAWKALEIAGEEWDIMKGGGGTAALPSYNWEWQDSPLHPTYEEEWFLFSGFGGCSFTNEEDWSIPDIWNFNSTAAASVDDHKPSPP